MGFKKNKSKYEKDNDDDDEKQYLLCGPSVAKSLVIIYNILFLISGILLIFFGIWTLTSKNDYADLLSSNLYLSSTYILIIAGAITILTSLLGIVSAWIEKKNLLIIFIALLIFIFLTEITAGVLAFVYRVKLKESLKRDLENNIKFHYEEPGYDKQSKLLDNLQIKFKCCGANDFRDWFDSKYVQANNITEFQLENTRYNLVSESCCKTPSNLCAKRIHPSNIYHKGCVSALENYISNHIILLGVVGLSSFLFQSVGIFLTALLIKRIKAKKNYEHVLTDENES
ncbi:unnamed protein product [Brachionus calyciflorus]|uniref:Tetraspanin n=1 Tax=Brachionus calyciflorus TaxID=104777 RepID=A0A813M2E0_9BILA|nr:unnamed protein product [Brachionus calyciflorus]